MARTSSRIVHAVFVTAGIMNATTTAFGFGGGENCRSPETTSTGATPGNYASGDVSILINTPN